MNNLLSKKSELGDQLLIELVVSNIEKDESRQIEKVNSPSWVGPFKKFLKMGEPKASLKDLKQFKIKTAQYILINI